VKRIKNMFGLFLAISVSGFMPLLCAQSTLVAKVDTPAIEVKMIRAGEIALPAEFQVALYEDLLQELEKEGAFSQVFRDGDRDAAKASDVVSLYATVTKFKQGSELERDVTTVGGSTLITVHCQFKAKDGAVLLERDIQGKVRLIGDNLKATDDFAKKAAKITPESFSAGTASSRGTGPKGGM
jgi:hypothetical protein